MQSGCPFNGGVYHVTQTVPNAVTQKNLNGLAQNGVKKKDNQPLKDSPSIVSETVDTVFGGCVPQPDGAIISAGSYKPIIWTKPAITKDRKCH